jgi:hypothetical protein
VGTHGRVGFDPRSFFPWDGRSSVSTLRATSLSLSKENRQIWERDDLVPRGAPSLGLGLDSLAHFSSHALPFFSPPSFHTLSFSPAFTSVWWSD